jgi:hypothetical protein
MLQLAIYIFAPLAILCGIASLFSVIRFVIGIYDEISSE